MKVHLSFALVITIVTIAMIACIANETTTGVEKKAEQRRPAGGVSATSLSPNIRNEKHSPKISGPALNTSGPELIGLQKWFNRGPTTIGQENAAGRVVLIDFWTYTCINCIRTFPFLGQWHEKYTDYGLTIIGVHSPEFEFEKESTNIADAILRNKIDWPVVQDNDFKTWRAFGNHYWPSKYLFDINGEIVYQHFGEGNYLETERKIREALTEAGNDISGIPFGGRQRLQRDPEAYTVTRELYGGYERNFSPRGQYAGQSDYYNETDVEVFYRDTVVHQHNKWYLQGLWRNERQAIVHARVTEGLEDYFALKFAARSVMVVINPVYPDPFEVIVKIDGRPLSSDQAGSDITWDRQGRSVLKVDGGREYVVVELDEFGVHELKLISDSANFAIYALTFGINLKGT